MAKKCWYCEGTGKIKKPNVSEDVFDDFVDREMDKGYFVNGYMAMEKAYKEFGYTEKECPHCKGTGIESYD